MEGGGKGNKKNGEREEDEKKERMPSFVMK